MLKKALENGKNLFAKKISYPKEMKEPFEMYKTIFNENDLALGEMIFTDNYRQNLYFQEEFFYEEDEGFDIIKKLMNYYNEDYFIFIKTLYTGIFNKKKLYIYKIPASASFDEYLNGYYSSSNEDKRIFVEHACPACLFGSSLKWAITIDYCALELSILSVIDNLNFLSENNQLYTSIKKFIDDTYYIKNNPSTIELIKNYEKNSKS